MSRISLSAKSGRALLGYFANVHVRDRLLDPAVEELRAALAPRKPKSMAVERKRARVSKRAAKGYETDEIRRQVLERAGGKCELCIAPFTELKPADLDHFFGRKGPQSERTCWALCRFCHREKTDSKPSAAHWLKLFIRHAEFHGHHAEAERARARLEGIVSVREAAAAGVRRG